MVGRILLESMFFSYWVNYFKSRHRDTSPNDYKLLFINKYVYFLHTWIAQYNEQNEMFAWKKSKMEMMSGMRGNKRKGMCWMIELDICMPEATI